MYQNAINFIQFQHFNQQKKPGVSAAKSRPLMAAFETITSPGVNING
jgi:hypothetical protein